MKQLAAWGIAYINSIIADTVAAGYSVQLGFVETADDGQQSLNPNPGAAINGFVTFFPTPPDYVDYFSIAVGEPVSVGTTLSENPFTGGQHFSVTFTGSAGVKLVEVPIDVSYPLPAANPNAPPAEPGFTPCTIDLCAAVE